jgi:hypothetical protein
VIEADKRANAKFWPEHNTKAEAACLIKRHSPPVNLLGGYKFCDAPAVYPAPKDVPAEPSSELKRYLDQIPPALSIPAFLKREPGS